MKRYKLLKDLAGLEAGSTLYLNELGNLVAEDKTTIVFLANFIHHYSLLDSDWLEEIPEEYKRWRAEKHGSYYFISDNGVVYDSLELYFSTDDYRYSIGNYFKTGEEAEKAVEWLKALTVLRDDTKGFKPDWEDGSQLKWVVEYHPHDDVQLVADYYRYAQDGVIYFATENDALESIKKHEREWLTLFGVEE